MPKKRLSKSERERRQAEMRPRDGRAEDDIEEVDEDGEEIGEIEEDHDGEGLHEDNLDSDSREDLEKALEQSVKEIEKLRLENRRLKRQEGPTMRGRGGKATGGFDRASDSDPGGYAFRPTIYKLGTIRQLPQGIPVVESTPDIYRLRSFLLRWMGPRSFILRCANAERALQDRATQEIYEDKWNTFEQEHTPGSMENLQADYYQLLSAHFQQSSLLVQFPDQISSETTNCATQLWNLVILKYSPRSPTMQAMVYARAASNLIRGPKNDWAGYDRDVANAVTDLKEMPSMTPTAFVACMMYAGLSNSTEAHWLEAARDMRHQVEMNTGKFDIATINYYISQAVPNASKAYAFNAKFGRVPQQGLDRPLPQCAGCPLGHCQFSDGKYRPIPRGGPAAPAFSSHVAAGNPARLSTKRAAPEPTSFSFYPAAPETSSETRRAIANLEGFNAVTMDQAQYTSMVAKLKDSMENDRCRHAYHAGMYANSGGHVSGSKTYDDDDDWETEEEEDY
jgi:hypothetical protein